MKKSFFDTSIFIYALENNSIVARNLFQKALHEGIIGTSTITIMEYATGCLKYGKIERLHNFRHFLKTLMFEVVTVDDVIALRAAEIRANYQFFKPMDALQLATAFVSRADVFYTNDKQLLQYKEVAIELLSDINS